VTDAWQPLRESLDRLQDHNRIVSFWIRDDDATEPTYPLERLFKLCAAHQVPLLLAVIPKPATPALAQLVESQPMIQPCQHGYAHVNHAPAGQRAQELGYRPAAVICEELRVGRGKLQQLFGDRLQDILAPPWNRYDTSIIPNLAALGFQAISGFGRLEGQVAEDLAYLDTHVDIIDWRKDRKTKPIADLITILSAEVERALQTNGQVAFLTHHLDHDEAAWDFLEALFTHTRSHPAVAWRSASDFMNRSADAVAIPKAR
jgi:xanthine/CO dehydrogenase XdhC/CoxF family maturation factor